MPNERREDVDRRDFMMAAIGLVGASAGLGSSAGTASAEDTKVPPVGLEPGALQRTVYTGDVIQGKKVISALDVNDLERGKKHAFYFEGVQMPTGQHWYLSAIVAVGAKPGKRIVLTSGVHGDEMSSVHAVQTIMNQLDAAQMSGTVLAVPDVSRPALEGMARRWPSSARGTDLIDMNREWPGNENGFSATSRHAGLVFNRLLKPNGDFALDFHTGTTGMDVTAFNLARMELPEVRAMAELFPIDQIFDNPAYPTLLPNAFIDVGIPALCCEIGASRILDLGMIPLFVEGTMNVLKHHGIISGPMGRTAKDTDIFVGNSNHFIFATHGGFVELLVKLTEKVTAGQKVAIQRNAFGSGRIHERCGRRGRGSAAQTQPSSLAFR